MYTDGPVRGKAVSEDAYAAVAKPTDSGYLGAYACRRECSTRRDRTRHTLHGSTDCPLDKFDQGRDVDWFDQLVVETSLPHPL